MKSESEDPLIHATPEPQVSQLITEYERCTPVHNNWNRLQTNEEIRFCRWAAQSPDGKKWDANMLEGQHAFPWDGASDCRPYTTDEIIGDLVATEFIAFWRALLQTQGIEAGDLEASAYANKLLQWLMGTRQYAQLVDQVELHSQYTHTYGWSALYITWAQEHQLKRHTVTMEQLLALAQSAANESEAATLQLLPQLILDPAQETAVVELITTLVPSITPKRARQAVRELRSTGQADIPIPYLCRDDPSIIALKPWEEVLIPNYCTDVQKASLIFVRQWWHEVDLRSKLYTDQWDERWVEEAIKHKGRYSSWRSLQTAEAIAVQNWSFDIYDAQENLIEVIWAYQRLLDEENVPGIYFTVFNPAVARDPKNSARELAAKHELLDYRHGKMPFVIRKREKWAPTITSSRGVPEITSTWQRSEKVQEDAITDQTSIGTLPPILTPKLAGVDHVIRPGGQIPVASLSQRPEFMTVPTAGARVAFEIWDRLEKRRDRYFGRRRLDDVPEHAAAKRQMMIQSNLLSWAQAFQQEFQLLQQFMAPEKISRIIGGPSPWSQAGGEIEGQFDFILSFDVRELDNDFMANKMKAIKDVVIPLDAMGRVDRGKLVELLLRAIDPTLARELIQGQESATQQTYRKVKTDLGLMLLGFEPEYVEMDPTAGAQMQFAREILNANPKAIAAINSDERFRELVQKYEQNLQQSVVQDQNKVVGRLGVQPQNPQTA